MRAVVLGPEGEPELVDVAEPDGPGELVEVLACGLCGSDVEKLGDASRAGQVLGHEVVARATDGRRLVLGHHTACGRCDLCRDGHESLCAEFAAPTIRPGGFAQRARAQWSVDVPERIDDARATMVEPLACVLRGLRLVPRGEILIVGHGFVGHLFAAALRHRGDTVYAADVDPRRDGPHPPGPVDAAVLCGPGGVDMALAAVRPGGTVLVFADAGPIPTTRVYRGELTVAGVRSASAATMRDAVALLRELELPEPTVLPLERFREGLELYRRRDVLKVVFTP